MDLIVGAIRDRKERDRQTAVSVHLVLGPGVREAGIIESILTPYDVAVQNTRLYTQHAFVNSPKTGYPHYIRGLADPSKKMIGRQFTQTACRAELRSCLGGALSCARSTCYYDRRMKRLWSVRSADSQGARGRSVVGLRCCELRVHRPRRRCRDREADGEKASASKVRSRRGYTVSQMEGMVP